LAPVYLPPTRLQHHKNMQTSPEAYII
jgi:hypothetical protein